MQTAPAIILAGGLGTRLRSVDSERPKPMVLIDDKPFLYWLIKHLNGKGFDHFILSIGYKASAIMNHDWQKDFPQCRFQFAPEEKPLGTGGAVAALFTSHSEIKNAWVFNGDTLLDHPLPPQPPNLSDEAHYVCLPGEALFDAQANIRVQNGRVLGVGGSPKSESSPHFVFDAGQVYVTRQAVKKGLTPEVSSASPFGLHTLLQKSIDAGKVGFTIVPGTCYDIGTPERLQRFAHYLESHGK